MDDKELLRYLDGKLLDDELDEQATAVIDRLRNDPDLQRQAAELRAVEAAYRAMGVETLPSERRKVLLEKLHREPAAPRYDVIHWADLAALVKIRSAHAPIFSLYLDLDPKRRVDEPPLVRYKALLRQAEQQIRPDQQSRPFREVWSEEVDRLRAWLETERPLQGQGLVVLSCLSIGLWRTFRLPVRVRDRLEISDRPYLRPLATLLDEFECYLVVLIDAGTARLIVVRLGTAEELSRVQGYVPPATGDITEKTGRRHDTYLHRHARSVAERAGNFWREQGCDWLVIGGTEEALGELRDQLPKAMRVKLAGELHLSPQVETGDILDRVLEIERKHERQMEAQRVEELITAAQKGGAAVLGLEATLLAIVEERVRLLIVEEEFIPAGWECSNCRFIGATQQDQCPLCGTALHSQPDIMEVALERVLDQEGQIEVLRGSESREALAGHGRIGALLRYAYSPPASEEDWSIQPKDAHEGTPVREELIDEALEATFPASDPPFWMPM